MRIQLLGSSNLQWGDQPLKGISSRRIQALLAYILLHRNPISRRQIAFHFWPDTSEYQAFSNLRNLLHQLKNIIPEGDCYIYMDRSSIQWKPDASYWLDVEEFETAVSRGCMEEAASLYQGDLLPDCYDDWIEPERVRLKEKFHQVLEALIQQKEEERDYPSATRYAQIYLNSDPFNENTYFQLMHLYVLQSDRTKALTVYNQYIQTLKKELGVEPDPLSTRLLHQILGSQKKAEVGSHRTSHRFVGRGEAWKYLLNKWHFSSQGNPHMCLVLGEAGIGKTRFLEEIQKWNYSKGITTAYARCYAAQRELAYGPVIAWLRCSQFQENFQNLNPFWLQEISRLLPEIHTQFHDLSPPRPIKESWQHRHFLEAISHVLLAASEPVMLILDDLQWIDVESLAYISFLLRFDSGGKLLLVGAARPEESTSDEILGSLRDDLQREGTLTEVELEPLSAQESLELINSFSEGKYSLEEANKIYTESEGSPLFIIETVMSLSDQKALSRRAPSHRAQSNNRKLPVRIEALISSRLSSLSEPAKAVAALASASGRQINLNVLSEAWNRDEWIFVDGLAELWRRRIVREQGEAGFDFSHEKIREAVYLRLSQLHRRLLHRSLAEALEKVNRNDIAGVCGEIANHYLIAGEGHKALPYFLKAGQTADRLYANQEAVGHLRRGAEIIAASPPNQERECELASIIIPLFTLLGDVLERTGKHEEARKAYQHIFDYVPSANPIIKAQIHRKIGETWLATYQFDHILESYNEAERVIVHFKQNSEGLHTQETPLDWREEWINIGISKMWAFYHMIQPQKIKELADELLPLVDIYASPIQKANYYNCLTGMQMRQDRFCGSQESLQLDKLGFEAALQTGEDSILGFGYFGRGFTHLLAGLLPEAEEYLLTGKSISERIGDVNLQLLSFTYLCVLHRRCGRVEKVRELIGSYSDAEIRQRPTYAAMMEANRAWLVWREGDFRMTRNLGESALETWGAIPMTYPFQWAARWPLIGLALSEDNLHEALHHVRLILMPDQQQLPEQMVKLLEKSITCEELRLLEEARVHLAEAAELAKHSGYL